MYNPNAARSLKIRRLWNAYNTRVTEYKGLKTFGNDELRALRAWFNECKVQSYKTNCGNTAYRRFHSGKFVTKAEWNTKVDERKAAEAKCKTEMTRLYVEIQNILDKLASMGERIPLTLSL